MLVTALLMAASLGVSPGASDPDGVVATARATPALDATYAPETPTLAGVAQEAAPHGLSTDQQIDRWLESRDPAAAPYTNADLDTLDDRQMHGEFSATVGTGGYRDYGVAVSLPMGENGRLDLSYRQVENGYGYGYGYGGLGRPYFNDSGYAFPGWSEPGQAWDYEMRVARPGGPPLSGPVVYPRMRASD